MAANLNAPAYDVRSDLIIVKVGANGQVSFFNNSGNVDLVADVAGWRDRPDSKEPKRADRGAANAHRNPAARGATLAFDLGGFVLGINSS